MNRNQKTKLEKLDHKIMKDSKIHSAVILITDFERNVLHQVQKGMSIGGLFYAASISKLYTHSIIFQLIDEEKINPTESITRYLPSDMIQGLLMVDGSDMTNEITIKHLIDQTSGLPDYETEAPKGTETIIQKLMHLDVEVTLDDAINLTRQLKAKGKPGSRAFYSNLNALLLGEIAERLTRKSLEELFQERIYSPLKLTNTFLLPLNTPITQEIAPVYVKSKPVVINKYLASAPAPGAVVTTAYELMLFIQGFYQGKLFHPNHLKADEFRPIQFFPMKYGAGQMYLKLNCLMSPFFPAPEIMGHSGSTGSFAFYCPEKQRFIVGTINQTAKQTVSLMYQFLNVM